MVMAAMVACSAFPRTDSAKATAAPDANPLSKLCQSKREYRMNVHRPASAIIVTPRQARLPILLLTFPPQAVC
jgi:hypothetical protein